MKTVTHGWYFTAVKGEGTSKALAVISQVFKTRREAKAAADEFSKKSDYSRFTVKKLEGI